MSEYDDLVARLRHLGMGRRDEVIAHTSDIREAAEAIQALQEQNEELAKDLAHSELNILSLEDKIAVLGREIFQARSAALEEAAQVAVQACLVPPDGGSPTEDEYRVCEAAASYIRALKTGD